MLLHDIFLISSALHRLNGVGRLEHTYKRRSPSLVLRQRCVVTCNLSFINDSRKENYSVSYSSRLLSLWAHNFWRRIIYIDMYSCLLFFTHQAKINPSQFKWVTLSQTHGTSTTCNLVIWKSLGTCQWFKVRSKKLFFYMLVDGMTLWCINMHHMHDMMSLSPYLRP